MPFRPEALDTFREGFEAGQQAGRSRDFLFAIGFAAGFLWAALVQPAPVEERGYSRVAQMP